MEEKRRTKSRTKTSPVANVNRKREEPKEEHRNSTDSAVYLTETII